MNYWAVSLWGRTCCDRISDYRQHAWGTWHGGDSMWNCKVIGPPPLEPVTLEEAKLHLRVDDDGDSPPSHPDDPLITALISAAREWCEGYSGLTLATQMLEMAGPYFPVGSLELPNPPIQTVSAVTYFDTDGVLQTVDPAVYGIDTFSMPPRLYLNSGQEWPGGVAIRPDAVRIHLIAGYGEADESPYVIEPLPASCRAAIKLIIGSLYENREDEGFFSRGTLELIPFGAQTLLDRFRVRKGFA